MNKWPKKVRYIGLSGWPKSGKDTVANLLSQKFGGTIIDDGMPLRKACIELYDIDPADPFTQEGKNKVYEIVGIKKTVRQLLGEMGNYVETVYGDSFMPNRAIQYAEKNYPDALFFIFPSVRKRQGFVYKERGGFILEVNRDQAKPLTFNEFDRWDTRSVDLVINNNGDLKDLELLLTDMPSAIETLVKFGKHDKF